MEQRTKWANLVNFYRANASWMKFAYETKKTNQSEYNKFMSLNVPSARIYLPKSIASQGGCVVDAYQMTQGSLASIEVTKTSTGWLSNLFLIDANAIPENPTVGEVSAQLLQANPALREGDQLSFVRFTQQTNSNTGVPYVVVRKYEVIINSSDIRPFYNFMPAEYILLSAEDRQDAIEVTDSGNAGGFVLIISRTIGGKTYVSTQSIIVANNSALIDAFSSPSAQQAAIDSYGESAEPFLTSTTADTDSQAATGNSIVSVKIDGIEYAPGTIAYPVAVTPSSPIAIRFSQDLGEGSTGTCKLYYWKNGQRNSITMAGVEVVGSVMTFTPDLQAAVSGIALADFQIEFESDSYRAVWIVPNEATVGGLE